MLIKNKKYIIINNLLLILLVVNFSASAFIVNNVAMVDCCHVQLKVAEPTSCCEMQETKTEPENCSTSFTANENDISGCGCIHNQITTKQTLQIVKSNDAAKILTVAELSNKFNYAKATNNVSNSFLIINFESPPIYLIDSSFLI